MGFVLVIANLLLGWIVLFRRGHLIKNVLVILAMWSYAVVAGLSAPVIRAALMMSFAQLALGTSQRGNGYNLVLGAAHADARPYIRVTSQTSVSSSHSSPCCRSCSSTRDFTATANAWVKSRTAS